MRLTCFGMGGTVENDDQGRAGVVKAVRDVEKAVNDVCYAIERLGEANEIFRMEVQYLKEKKNG